MSATLALEGSQLDRRALLRAGLLGGAALAVGVAGAAGAAGMIERVAADLGRDAMPRSSSGPATVLPDAATWAALVGHEVVLTGDGLARSSARVVKVTDIAHPSPHVVLRGDAYSLLLDVPSLPDASSVLATIHHPSLDAPTLVLMPVNGDGSWEAVVDRRIPDSTP